MGTTLANFHLETAFMGVILRRPTSGGTTKNLIVTGSEEILRGACRKAQNDMEEFPDGK
jgi:hypothetical protein